MFAVRERASNVLCVTIGWIKCMKCFKESRRGTLLHCQLDEFCFVWIICSEVIYLFRLWLDNSGIIEEGSLFPPRQIFIRLFAKSHNILFLIGCYFLYPYEMYKLICLIRQAHVIVHWIRSHLKCFIQSNKKKTPFLKKSSSYTCFLISS